MFVGIDIGNTSTVLGIYGQEGNSPETVLRYETDKSCTGSSLAQVISGSITGSGKSPESMTSLCFSSVVPEINAAYHLACEKNFSVPCYEIRHDSDFSIGLNYREPEQLGIDRIVNVEAAFMEYGPGCIIIDIGTAATFDILDFSGNFDGGLIAPGIGTTIKALSGAASRLPEVDFERPDRLVARDTVNAIKSGFYYGWLSLVDGLIEKIMKEYGSEMKVILTGGFGEKISEGLDRQVTIDSLLTMKGIKYIYDRNRK